MKDKINLEVTTWEANLILDAFDVYLKGIWDNTLDDAFSKRCSDVLYLQGKKFRRNLHKVLTKKGQIFTSEKSIDLNIEIIHNSKVYKKNRG